MVLNKTDEIGRSTEQLKESLDLKVQQAQSKLDGVSKKIKQSQIEVDKLAQRQVANSATLKNIKDNIDELVKDTKL